MFALVVEGVVTSFLMRSLQINLFWFKSLLGTLHGVFGQDIKAETHNATNHCDASRRQVLSSALMLRQVAAMRHLFGARNRFWKRGNVNYFKFNMAGN